MLSDSYHYTFNHVYHPISKNNMIIQNHLLSQIDEKGLMSQKYLLKYLHDFFIFHNIDYSLFNNTLLGYHLFEGLHIFYHQIELLMMYRDFQEFSKELINDGFHIDFTSQYLCVISSSFINKIQVKAFIYFIHNGENSLYFLSPLYVSQCKKYKDLLKEKETYHLKFVLLNQLFPCKKVKYEDFEIFIPNKVDKILEIIELKRETYIFDDLSILDKKIKKKEEKENNHEIEEKNILKNIFHDFLGAATFSSFTRDTCDGVKKVELPSLFWKSNNKD